MTPTQFKDARIALGLTQNECAKALGLKTSRAIRQFESGDREVSGPVAKLVEMLITQKTNGQPPRFSPAVAGKRKAATAVQTEGMENG
jgi:transcriptional regulator with XRE-family HTH domain